MVSNDNLQDRIFDKIINHFDQMIVAENRVDLVVVPGDITSEGKVDQYDKALLFFERLRHSLNIDSSRFFFTPGNHDYNRDSLGTAFKYIETPNSMKFEEIFSSSDFKVHVDNAFSNYIRFQERFLCEKHSIFGYTKTVDISKFKINITSLNSCLANSLAQDKLPSFIHIDGIKDTFKDKNDFNLSILVQHHPPHCLYPNNRRNLEMKIGKSFDIVVVGHEHYPDSYIKKEISREREYITFIMGTLYLPEKRNPEKYRYRFSILDYDPYTARGIHSYFHTERGLNFCPSDTSVSPEARKDGIIRFSLPYREKEISEEISDPLKDYEITKELEIFFYRNQKKITRANSKEELITIRKQMKSVSSLNIEDFALNFLKYLISKDLIINFEKLYEALKEIFLLKQIQYYHNRILDYYNERYFESREESIQDHLSRRRKDIKLIELQKELSTMTKELEKYRKRSASVIERYKDRPVEFLPPLPSEEVEDNIEYLDWYKRLGLKENPFPSKDGLSNINPEYYDEIIYPTNSINQFKHAILRNFSSIKNITMCVYGAFGSGKTTLFQYMNRLINLHYNDTIVIIFSLDARERVVEIKRKFFVKLRSHLKKVHQNEFDYTPEEIDPEEDCLIMLKTLSTVKKALIIFIEDIYKHSSIGEYMEEIIGFITSLQIYRKDFSHEISTSFFFSAIDELSQRIKGDRSISGSVDDYHPMSSVTIDEALAMINHRLKVFSIEVENAPSITRDYLVRLSKMEKHPGRPIKTFRDYIEILIKRFKRLEFTEDSITIREDDVEIRNARKDIERSHNQLHKAFQELKTRTESNRDTFERLIKVLEDIWLSDPIIEGSYDFLKNRELIIHLFSVGLLIKKETDQEPSWTINENCNDYFNKINHIYSVNPVNIIPSLYFVKEIPEEYEDEVLLALENTIKRGEEYGSAFIEKLVSAARGYKEVYQFSKSLRIAKESSLAKFNVEIIQESFSSLLMAYVIQCDSEVQNYEEALEFHENSWYELEVVTYFAKLLKSFMLKISPSLDDKTRLISDYLSTIKDLVSRLKRFVQWDIWFSLKGKGIWREDKILLNDIRRNVESNNFDLAINKIKVILEEKLKNFIFNYTRILFGDNKWRRGLPQDLNKRLKSFESYIPIPNIDEREILANLDLRDYFRIIKFLNTVKTEQKIEFLKIIEELCDNIEKRVILMGRNLNPWTSDILELVERLDQFYFYVFSEKIPCPWNSHILSNLQDIQIYENETSILRLEKLLQPNLILDKQLKPKWYIEETLEFLDLIYSVIKIKNKLTIEIDYKKEEIIIIKKSEYLN